MMTFEIKPLLQHIINFQVVSVNTCTLYTPVLRKHELLKILLGKHKLNKSGVFGPQR